MKAWFLITVFVTCSVSHATEFDHDLREKPRQSAMAISVYGGNPDHGKGLHQDSYIAMITGELVESPIGYEFLAIGIGNASFTENRISVGTLGFVLNLVPIDTKWLRVSVGGGGGFAAIEEVDHYEKYDQTGGHVVGQGALMFFSPSLRLGFKAIWLKTRFSGGNVPIVNEANDVGSGIYYLVGMSFEFEL